MTKDEMMTFIDNEVGPTRMSPKDALDYLEGLRDDLDARVEALRDEVAQAEKEGDKSEPEK